MPAEDAGLLSLEEYFQLVGQDVSGALVVDGRFHGWVSPAVCERYGIADCAGAAWEGNGGGKFSFKIDKKGGSAGGHIAVGRARRAAVSAALVCIAVALQPLTS